MDDVELSVNAFHEKAVQSYIASRLLISTSYLFPVGYYNAHLACECMLKSLTAQAGSQPVVKHDLLLLSSNLQALTNDSDFSLERYMSVLSWLNPYQELGRYGALARPQNDPDRSTEGPLQLRGAVASQPSHDIREIDYVFSLLRSKSSQSNDIISKILRSETVSGWNYPITIEEVVLAQNDYIS